MDDAEQLMTEPPKWWPDEWKAAWRADREYVAGEQWTREDSETRVKSGRQVTRVMGVR